MKIKALRNIENKEFMEMIEIGGEFFEFTSGLPRLLNPDATRQIICEYFKKNFPDVDLSKYELVEFELKEVGSLKLVK